MYSKLPCTASQTKIAKRVACVLDILELQSFNHLFQQTLMVEITLLYNPRLVICTFMS